MRHDITNYYGLIDISTPTDVLSPFKNELICWPSRETALRLQAFDYENIKNVDIGNHIKMNSHRFRSDEFIDSHDGKHILFSGCSVTYGVGLKDNEIWSSLLFNKIKEKEKVSGYYNLAIPGTGIFDIVINIFKYIDKYGSPDSIFINLPGPSRFYALINKEDDIWTDKVSTHRSYESLENKYKHAIYNYPNNKMSTVIDEKAIYIYQYLFMLETFCKNNNIDLYLFSYIYDLGDLIKITDLQTFYNFDEKEILKKIYQYHEDNPKDKFYLKARDEKHPGTAQNYAWYDSLYNIYLERNHVSRR